MYDNVQQSKHRHVVAIVPAEVGDETRVWDYDELSEQAQRAFRAAVRGEQSERIVGVDSGAVILYTEYYLVC